MKKKKIGKAKNTVKKLSPKDRKKHKGGAAAISSCGYNCNSLLSKILKR